MKKHRLIRLIKDRSCYLSKTFLPKYTVIHANHLVEDVWAITLGKDNNIAISVLEYEHFEFVD